VNKIGITKIQAVIVIAVIVIATAGGLAYYLLSQLKPAAQVVEITLWEFGGIGSEHVYLRWLVEQFNKEHPNIKVKWEHKSWML
jgi:ABC-type glycerol-3-phosphate transport system substrate-binding protein